MLKINCLHDFRNFIILLYILILFENGEQLLKTE